MRRLPTFQAGEWLVRSWIADRDALLLERWLGEWASGQSESPGEPRDRDVIELLLQSPCMVAWSVARMKAATKTRDTDADLPRLETWLRTEAIPWLCMDALHDKNDADENAARCLFSEGTRQTTSPQGPEASHATGSLQPSSTALWQRFFAGMSCLVVTDHSGDPVDWRRCWSRWWPRVSCDEFGEPEVAAEFLHEALAEFATGFEDRLQRWARLMKVEQEFASALERAKLSAMKELAYGASHEINNPLANISTRAQTLLREETHPERRQKLAMINAQAFRAHEMISNMMLFAHPPDLQRQRVSWQAVLDQVQLELQEDADRQQTTLVISPAGFETAAAIAELDADPTHLAVLLKALVRNSFEAIGSGGRVELRCRFDDSVPIDDGDRGIRLEVIDDGPGIPLDVREHLFDPFYSGREAGRGLGFGLSKAWRIVEMHGGRLSVADAGSEPGCETDVELADSSGTAAIPKGTVFVVQLPLPCEGSAETR